MERSLENDFAKPGPWFRGQPFWAWNGALEPQELRRQIRLMKRMGMGGFFMHSRIGLSTPYLRDEWFRSIEVCIDEAQKQNMLAWLYDDDRWPSGAAGGLVTRNPRYRKRSLLMEELKAPAQLRWTAEVVAAFRSTVKGTTASGVQPIPRGRRPSSLSHGERILSFRVLVDPVSSWYNDATYLDTLNPAAVRRFIAVTHEEYRRHVGRHFGKTLPGIFTDEPNHGQKFDRDNNTGSPLDLPWTEGLPAAFKKRYGYDLIPHLVELYLDVDGQQVTPARHDFHDCLTALFVDSFSRQIGAWCEEHGLMHTGHVLMEDRLSSQACVVGSAMRFYEPMQAPGIDLLTERWRAYATAKQVSSVAHQLGKRWRISESYGATGWDFPFVGHKAIFDWQFALGINLRCQHLAWYTMRGEAKRDYPAAISAQSPWWELYPVVEDYFSRVATLLSRGEEVRDLLVIHPVESTWTMIRRGWLAEKEVQDYDRVLVDLEDTLLGAHLDFDYGDEEMLSRLAAVSRRKGTPLLVVGRACYAAVVVPPLRTIRSSTLMLLAEFQAAGGLVVFTGEPPRYVDAAASDAPADLAAQCVAAPPAGPQLAAAVDKAARRVSVTDAEDRELASILYQLREDKDAYYLFLCNTSLTDEDRGRDIFDTGRISEHTLAFPNVTVRARLACDGEPLELDPSTGEIFQADSLRAEDGAWQIATSFPANGSRLFLFPRKPEAQKRERRPPLVDHRRIPLEDGRWTILRSEANVLVLDRPSYRVDGGSWQGPEEVLRVDGALRAAVGVPPRGGAMVQPWARKRTRSPRRVEVELHYRFEVEAIPTGELSLCVEDPSRYAISLNGAEICSDGDNGFWVDPSLRRLPVDPALLLHGENTLTLRGPYDEEHPGLEIVYLLGEFGVEVKDTEVFMIDAPRSLALGSWIHQGLPFYSGSVCYCRRVAIERSPEERIVVEVPEYRGVAARVLVDGRPAGVTAWDPPEVDITSLLPEAPGSVEIRIEVIGHRRNSHGPLHHAASWPAWTGPAEFTTKGELWKDGYSLVPCGLLAQPEVVARRPG
ncbi:MAG TPA: glycosyl hydrolase [Spirochaetia bacterium]|nr:glycosyl hydrolase [Spirochaetia bacterium]